MKMVKENLQEVTLELSSPKQNSGVFQAEKIATLHTHKNVPCHVSKQRMLISIPVNSDYCLPSNHQPLQHPDSGRPGEKQDSGSK